MKEVFVFTCGRNTSRDKLELLFMFLYECRGVGMEEHEMAYTINEEGEVLNAVITLESQTEKMSRRICLAKNIAGIGRPEHITSGNDTLTRHYRI